LNLPIHDKKKLGKKETIKHPYNCQANAQQTHHFMFHDNSYTSMIILSRYM